MRFDPDPFVGSLIMTLLRAGFVNTAGEITRSIASGNGGEAYPAAEQEAIFADIIQHNIIRPHEMWRKIVNMRTSEEKRTNEEEFLMVADAVGREVPLGSHDYEVFVLVLQKVVADLRRPPGPRDPTPGKGGGGPPSPSPSYGPTTTPSLTPSSNRTDGERHEPPGNRR
ncbi:MULTISPECIES: hypothetical protein [unclassified Rhizobium]|uniref:hypothetical protein n=1 Tax=unclassified Rhizobium TaxID=2613769 RepID=UPI001ADAEB9A|nr:MULTISPECIES: hypothetical protein [unclassified Rhizobium]MBO9127690.1 hypothetical protein [Rhizobium sp. 16-488-2b]MBO9178152.1 hypothetical protein [Rhizobium sp. 16-488-2a]